MSITPASIYVSSKEMVASFTSGVLKLLTLCVTDTIL